MKNILYTIYSMKYIRHRALRESVQIPISSLCPGVIPVVSGLWSLVLGPGSWVLGPGSWSPGDGVLESWGSGCWLFLRGATPIVSGHVGPCRAGAGWPAQLFTHSIFGALTDVVLDAFWPPKVAQRLPKSIPKSIQNRHRQPPPQRSQKTFDFGPVGGRCFVDF